MRSLFYVIAALLAGCASPRNEPISAEAMRILSNPSASAACDYYMSATEARFQIGQAAAKMQLDELGVRPAGCYEYALAKQRIESNRAQAAKDEKTIRALEILNATYGYKGPAALPQPVQPGRPAQTIQPARVQPLPIPPVQTTPIAFLKRSYVSGLNRICVYDRLGSEVAITIQSFELCPQTN